MSELAIAGVGALALGLGLGLIVYLVIAPGRVKVARTRLDPDAEERPGVLSGAATAATEGIGRVLERRGSGGVEAALERAGVKTRPQDFVFLVGVATFVAGALGVLLANLLIGIVLAALIPLLVKVRLDSMAETRRRKFAEQLDDALQLMASSLRAGHSLPQSLDAVARQAPSPTSEEFARVINETRVGRDMGQALAETAGRMRSDDFLWATQAIAINREVGGNLSEVLDGVGHTIRERNAIRRQVKALSAEGRLSAIILMLLPIGVALFLLVVNPSYILRLTEGLFGFTLLGIAALLLLIGGLWLRKMVQIKF